MNHELRITNYEFFRRHKFIFVVLILNFLFFIPAVVLADEYTSTNFKVLDPVITSGGEYSTSAGYKLFGATSQIGIGANAATAFGINAGFLYYPAPVVSPTPTPTPTGQGGGPAPGSIKPPIILTPLVLIPPDQLKIPTETCGTDLNCDKRVDIVDFSIFVYLADKEPSLRFKADFDKDGQVGLKDLSILFSGWTDRFFAFLQSKNQGVNEVFEESGGDVAYIIPQGKFAFFNKEASQRKLAAQKGRESAEKIAGLMSKTQTALLTGAGSIFSLLGSILINIKNWIFSWL